MQLAQHLPTEQLVAIKFLRRGGTLDPRLIAREVCASRKSSPGFVAVDFAKTLPVFGCRRRHCISSSANRIIIRTRVVVVVRPVSQADELRAIETAVSTALRRTNT